MNVTARSSIDPAHVLGRAIEALNNAGGNLPLDDVNRALRIVPHDYRLWHIKGLIHREQEQRELAIPALRRAVDLAPNEPLVAHGYARTLLEAGLPSVEAFGRAMKLAPTNPEVIRGMVTALVAEQRVGHAIEGLEIALGRSPHWADGHALLSSLHWTQGQRMGFTSSFDAALGRFPRDIELRRQQILALIQAEQWDEALKRIAEGRAAVGDHAIFDVNEAVVLSETGDIAGADALFARFSTVDDGIIQVRRVWHLLRSARPQEASDLLDAWLYRPEGFMFWPYASIAWRLVDKERWQWLEGDERFVGVYDISDRLPPVNRLAETLRQLHTLSGQPLEQSLRGGTQTDGNLFHRIDPILVQLREAIRATVAEHVSRFPEPDVRHPLLGPRRDKIIFEGAWSVRLHSRGYHANHIHPAGWISSALYFVLPPDLGRDEAGWLTLGEPQAELKLDMPPFRSVEPRPGRLVLFPSYMWHGTRPFGEGERMTVAFDVARS